MKIPIDQTLNPIDVLRRAGYGFVNDRNASEPSYSRRMGSGIYPRFHAYINGAVINLHLDQKQVSYAGSSAHSGEYDGPTVETEGQRIAMQAQALVNEKSVPVVSRNSEPKAGWFGKMFGN